PAGFSSAGTVSVVAGTAAAAAAGVAAAGGGGVSSTALVLGGVAVAGGAAAAVVASTGEAEPDRTTVDGDGDGFTPQQGDCRDDDPGVGPNGTVVAFVTYPNTG